MDGAWLLVQELPSNPSCVRPHPICPNAGGSVQRFISLLCFRSVKIFSLVIDSHAYARGATAHFRCNNTEEGSQSYFQRRASLRNAP